MNFFVRTLLLFTASSLLFTCSNSENLQDSLTVEDYRRAESFLSGKRDSQISGELEGSWWQADDILLYATSTYKGLDFFQFDPETGESIALFDQNRMADALSKISKSDKVVAEDLSLRDPELKGTTLKFSFENKTLQCDLNTYNIIEIDEAKVKRSELMSPDGKMTAYIKDYNLWIRDLESGKHTQVTFDGEKDYGYATNNAGWRRSEAPVLIWSPNSDKIATFRHDGRNVAEMYLYTTQVGHSKLDQWKYPLPGDSVIFMIERLVVDLQGPKPKVIKLKMPPDPHRSTTSDHIAGRGGEFLDVDWNDDASVLSFVSSSRDHKQAILRVADPTNGKVRTVMQETAETYYEGGYSRENWRVFPKSNEAIWFSEKSNWGHLYLHDLETGALKNTITSGEWAVLDIVFVDEENRLIYFMGSNKEEGDPYFHYLYRVGFDGSDMKLLTPERAYHTISVSNNSNYFIDSYSTPTVPTVSVLRNINGEIVKEITKTDISVLLDSGWVAPNPFTVKARDGETDIYGLMYKPSNIDESKKYPILNYLYPGPQSGSVGRRSFSVSRSDKQAVAELGFIVVELDAMGTPGRSKSFHDAYYANMGDNGLPDQIAGIRQLADNYSFMDTTKVGIWGHSGGGFASTAGILRYPDFYKVAVSSAGNHDNRNYEDDWGEKWHGLLVRDNKIENQSKQIDVEIQEQPGGDNYDIQANQLLAGNLKGKLLLAHGMLDDNVPPTNTLLVAEALMNANKEFDMLVLPNATHGFSQWRSYFMKKRWNYFLEHLQGREPIYDFEFKE